MKTEILECGYCGWKGTFEQGVIEFFEYCIDCRCPECGGDDDGPNILAVTSYPTLQQARASSDPDVQKIALAVDAFQAEFDAEKLEDPNQLPEIEANRFTLSWDCMEDPLSKNLRTVICYKDSVIFSEPAVYEGFERFAEVARILKSRYGRRLKDLVPTEASGTYLYGDTYRSFSVVKGVRAELFGPQTA